MCCSLSCLWFRVQQHTSGLHDFQILGCLCTIIGVPGNEIEPKVCIFLTESKGCMNSASYEHRQMSARGGEQVVPMGMPTVCWKTFHAKTTTMLSTRNPSILIMSFSEFLFLESECSFTNLLLRGRIFVYAVTVFENEGVLDYTCDSPPPVSGEVWLYKVWKIQKTWCWLHGWNLEMKNVPIYLLRVLEDTQLIDYTFWACRFAVRLKTLPLQYV